MHKKVNQIPCCFSSNHKYWRCLYIQSYKKYGFLAISRAFYMSIAAKPIENVYISYHYSIYLKKSLDILRWIRLDWNFEHYLYNKDYFNVLRLKSFIFKFYVIEKIFTLFYFSYFYSNCPILWDNIVYIETIIHKIKHKEQKMVVILLLSFLYALTELYIS